MSKQGFRSPTQTSIHQGQNDYYNYFNGLTVIIYKIEKYLASVEDYY